MTILPRTVAEANPEAFDDDRSLASGPEGLRVIQEEEAQEIEPDDNLALGFFSASELLEREFPPVRWAIPGVLPEGLSLLCGKPKLGKSWLTLGLAVSVSTGTKALGEIEVDPACALYLGLEDNPRRLQARLRTMAGEADHEGLQRLSLATNAPRLDEGLLDLLDGWLDQRPEARLVIVDTLGKALPAGTNPLGYAQTYDLLQGLKGIADRHQIALLAVHHLRKGLGKVHDLVDEIWGSVGLASAADNLLVLRRERGRGDASLFVTGRDLEREVELALRWDRQGTRWLLLGNAEDHRHAGLKGAILETLKGVEEPGLGPTQVFERVREQRDFAEVKLDTVGRALRRLVQVDALLRCPRRGKYVLLSMTEHDSPRK